MYIDKHVKKNKRKPEYELKTFYGQIEHIYAVTFTDPQAKKRLNLLQDTVILVALRPCVLDDQAAPFGLDIHYYSRMGALDIVDVTTVQCLVGRIPIGNGRWAIIDRSGSLARALVVENQDNNNETSMSNN